MVPTYKEQMVSYCGVKILLNLSDFTGLAELYPLYWGVLLFKKSEHVTHDDVFFNYLHNFPSQSSLLLSPTKKSITTITEQTTGSATQYLSSLLQNQGSSRKLVILPFVWYILLYVPMKTKGSGVCVCVWGGGSIAEKIGTDY